MNTKRKAVNMAANRVFFCVYGINNPYFKPELINITYPEIWGTLHVICYLK